MKKLFALIVLMFPWQVFASCVCNCVDGEVKPVCTSTYDTAPICQQRICPLTTTPLPDTQTVQQVDVIPHTTSRAGTPGGCTHKQIYNEQTHRYETQDGC